MQYIIPFMLKHTITTVFTFNHDVLNFFSQTSHSNVHNSSPGVPLIRKAQFFNSFKDTANFVSLFLLMYQKPMYQLQSHLSHVQTLAQNLEKRSILHVSHLSYNSNHYTAIKLLQSLCQSEWFWIKVILESERLPSCILDLVHHTLSPSTQAWRLSNYSV